MKPRSPLWLYLLLELAAAILIGQTMWLRRNSYDEAWLDWHRNPTSEHRAAFNAQQRINEAERCITSLVIFALLGGATVLVFRWQRKHGDTPPRVTQPSG